jgi:glycosyltransferase involved in cell wall biosynthesis
MENIIIVIPVYNESNNILSLYKRLVKINIRNNRFNWSYIFVNDGSTDDSLVELRKLAEKDEKVKVIDLSRNFGKEIAMTAGVHEAVNADAIVCIDADLQHPPELIPVLIEKWKEGYDIVATIRKKIENQPILKRIGSHVFYWIMAKISGLQIKSQTTDFRLYDKKVVDAFLQTTERERMFRGIMDWLGFHKAYVEFEADAREEGEAGYSYKKLIGLAINSITSFSLWPLRITGYLGMLITSLSGLILMWMLLNFFIQSKYEYTALAIVVVANTFFIGIVLMAIGIVALYIGSIHTEVINRPLYLIREKINFK